MSPIFQNHGFPATGQRGLIFLLGYQGGLAARAEKLLPHWSQLGILTHLLKDLIEVAARERLRQLSCSITRLEWTLWRRKMLKPEPLLVVFRQSMEVLLSQFPLSLLVNPVKDCSDAKRLQSLIPVVF